MKKNQKGSIQLLLLLGIILFAIFASGGITSSNRRLSTFNKFVVITQTIATPKIEKDKNLMQVQDLKITNVFATIEPGSTTARACLQPTGDIENLLETKYNIHVIGTSPNPTQEQLAAVYQVMCMQYQSATYVGLLNATPSDPVYINFAGGKCGKGHSMAATASDNSCGGHRCSEVGWCPQTTQGNISANKFVIAHEVAHHILRARGPVIQQYDDTLFNNPAVPKLPTFNCQADYLDDTTQNPPYEIECFPDMVGEYLFYKTYFHDCTLNPDYTIIKAMGTYTCKNRPNFSDFKTSYSDWYNFAKNNIFDGIEF